LFRFRVSVSQLREVEITRPGKDTRIAEMRTQEIRLPSEIFFVISLRDITEWVQLRAGSHTATLVDELTGLCNRQGFLTLAQQQLKIANRTRKWLSFLVVNINHMKWINGAFGRAKVDQVLLGVAGILKATFRNSDIIARIGGDYFAVLALEAHYSSSHIMSARLQKNLENYNLRERQLYRLSLSTGFAFYDPDHPCSVDDLISRAEAAILANSQPSSVVPPIT
jgi:two-component system cell cycle response regulator